MKSLKAEFDRRGIAVLVISFAEPAKLLRYQQYHGWPFVMLADPERAVYRAFELSKLSLFRVFSPATLRLYFKLLWQGARPRRYGSDDYYQSGGDFIIDRGGHILFVHRSREPADRPSARLLLERCDALQSSSSSY